MICNQGDRSGALRLSDVPLRGKATILELCLPASAQEYLMRLGFVPGAEVEVVRRGPLHGPVVYRLLGTDIAIRSDTAEFIYVQMSPGGGAAVQ